MTTLDSQPNIQQFVTMFEMFLKASHLPHYSCFPDIMKLNDQSFVKYVTESCEIFVDSYIRYDLDDSKKYKIIAEYGMKKLIDLQISYEGNSICEELLDLNEHLDRWVYALLMNVANLH